MPQVLTISRAARLVGVPRGTLQNKIKAGELRSFDGMVTTEDLLATYPSIQFKEDLVFEHIMQIKDEAFAKRVRERVLPDKEVLAARLYEQSRELADIRTHLQRYHSIIVQAQARLHDMDEEGSFMFHPAIASLSDWLDHQLEEVLDTQPPDALTVLDDYLRVVSAHVVLRPSGHEFFVDGADTVLEAALRSGIALNYGCSSGNCGLCKARIIDGHVKKVRHHDYVLSEAEKTMGYTLLCSYTAVSDLVVEALEATRPGDIPKQEVQARVKVIEPLTDKVRRLHLQTPRSNRLRFMAGQSVELSLNGSVTADYAVASCPCDDRNLEFHIRDLPEDEFAQKVFHGLKNGDMVTVQGPFGEFVLDDDSQRPLLFIACNNGFAPIKSLIEHAMALDTMDAIHLYWLATFPGGHYQSNLCRSWADALDNFSYAELATPTLEVTSIQGALQQLEKDCPDLSGYEVYFAGAEAFVTCVSDWLTKRGVPAEQMVSQVA